MDSLPTLQASPATAPLARQGAVWRKALLLFGLAVLAAVFYHFHLGRYLSLDYLQGQRVALLAERDAHPLAFIATYFAVYALATGLSVPGAVVLTLAGGALFGLVWGTIIVSFASTVGATLAFFGSRFLLRDYIQTRFADKLHTINEGIARDGAFYLFTLRLIPLFPFFLINLLLGLTRMPMRTYFWVSQVGMLAGTIVYVNAGTQLAQLSSAEGILSPALIGSFALLGVVPLGARRFVASVQRRRVYWGHAKPRTFDRNLIVIGAGSAGLVAAYIAAALKAKVTLIEKHRMGGDCLNTGCVPSKALIRTTRLLADAKRASEFGIAGMHADVRFAQVMARVRQVVEQVEPHDSVQRYGGLGVECLLGQARIANPWTVEVKLADGATRSLTARDIVVAAGAEPSIPPIPGLRETGYLTSDTIWELRELPKRLIVLGGGPIGCELAQAFARLGSAVTQVEMLPRLLIREDPEISERVASRFRAEGIALRLNMRANAVVMEGETKVLVCEAGGSEQRISFDEILVAVGRKARLAGYGLEALGLASDKTLEVNEFLQTRFPNIYACGDVAGPYQFTHTAAHMAWYCAVNSLLGPLLALRGGRFKVDWSVIPWATFTEPEVARVGLNELEAKEKGISYEVTTFPLEELDRAIADGAAHGLVKVLTVPGKDRILGVTIVGEHAGDVIAEYVLAMRHGIGLNKILGTIHIYPTLAEMNKYAAGAWKRAHQPERALRWLERFHTWRRS